MNILRGLIDLIYPPKCIICQDFIWANQATLNGKPIDFCQDCLEKLIKIEPPFCVVCGKPFAGNATEGHHCQDCLIKPPHYDRLSSPYLFEGAIVEAIYELKYEFKTYVAESLGALLADFAIHTLGVKQHFTVIPVPLHHKRLRQRGFNQSLLLARYVARAINARLDFTSLVRTKETQPQTGLKKKERQKNVNRAFEIKNPDLPKGQNILLVDDVATTGSTLNECARVLKKAGSTTVIALVLARAVT